MQRCHRPTRWWIRHTVGRPRTAAGLAAVVLLPATTAVGQLTVVDSAAACRQLAGLQVAAGEIALPTGGATIASTEFVAAGAPGNDNGEFCKVLGSIHPVSYAAPDIRFEVNLPTRWNGKFVHFGGGGFNGTLVTGLGHYVRQPDTETTPLARGYVTAGSDSGHQSDVRFDGRFMLNDEALRNYGHEQVSKTHDVAMVVLERRYGRQPQLSFFIGGSQGGHEAFDAVQRYADDYDGVLAGYPAHNLVMLHLSALRYAQALHGEGGAAWLSPSKAVAFVRRVYATCDGLDGIEDGIIGSVTACRRATRDFRLTEPANPIRCPGGADTGSECLADAQIRALNVMDSPYQLGFGVQADDGGNSTFPKWTPFEGSTFFDGGSAKLGEDGPGQALQLLPGDATARYGIAQDLTIDTINDFDPRRYAGRIAELVPKMSANSTNLDRFRARGGRLIFFHGAVDDYIPVYSSIQYYERLAARYTADQLGEFVRFYTIPGMGHVTGPFNARIAYLDALEAWVESGRPPETLLATDANAETRGRTRPVCRYPAWPRYRGHGSADEAGSFECAVD